MSQDGSVCDGKYELSYDGSAPIFICNKCAHIDTTWKTFYSEYLSLWKQKDNWNDKKHQITCIIGFFCHLYKEAYGTDYAFVPNNPNPYSSKECKEAWKLLSTFGGDANIVRKYLWWFFTKQFRKSMDIVSLNYFNAPGLIRKYNLIVQKQKTITRASLLPDNFIVWCKANAAEIFNNYELSTMNDLGALLQFYTAYKMNDAESLEAKVIQAARDNNLIVENKLNVG